MPASDADVLVVGAGPAGATVALLLARAGLDVLVLERCALPRAKPCGDCLSPQANRVLDRLGVLDDILALGPARLPGWRIVAGSGDAFDCSFDTIADGDARVRQALAVERLHLDAALMAAASRAGARVRTGVRVTALAADGALEARVAGERTRLRAPLVIGADGLRSVLRRWVSGPSRRPRLRKVSLTAHMADVDAADGFGEMHLGERCCVGIAPVRADRSVHNVTVVVDAAEGPALARDPGAFFHDALRRFPAAHDRLRMARPIEHAGAGPFLASGPFDFTTRRIVAPGMALVGDAAGYYDPFTGQGIHQALADAELLAGLATAALREGDPSSRRLRSYARARARSVRGKRLVQRGIETVVRRRTVADPAIRRLRCTPAAARALLAVTGDLAAPTSLLSPALLLELLVPHHPEEEA